MLKNYNLVVFTYLL